MKIRLSTDQVIGFHLLNTLLISSMLTLGLMFGSVVTLTAGAIWAGMYLRRSINVVISALFRPTLKDRVSRGIEKVCSAIVGKPRPVPSFDAYIKHEFEYIRPFEFILDAAVISAFIWGCMMMLPGANIMLVALSGSAVLCGFSSLILPYGMADTTFDLNEKAAASGHFENVLKPVAPSGPLGFLQGCVAVLSNS